MGNLGLEGSWKIEFHPRRVRHNKHGGRKAIFRSLGVENGVGIFYDSCYQKSIPRQTGGLDGKTISAVFIYMERGRGEE